MKLNLIGNVSYLMEMQYDDERRKAIKQKISCRGFIILAAFFLFAATMSSTVRADEIVCDLKDFVRGDLAIDGFELKGPATLSIDIIGVGFRHSDDMLAFGWILNAETREPVWNMADEETKRYNKSRNLREFTGTINLPSGKYEVNYFVGGSIYIDNFNFNFDDLDEAADILEEIFGNKDDEEDDDIYYSDDDDEYYYENIDDLKFTIRAPQASFAKFNPVERLETGAVINFSRPEDDFMEKKGFSLKKNLSLRVIAIGEYSSNDRVFVDYGWIINAATREKVWQMDKWNTSWAGGGRKNRGFNDVIELPAGNYIAGYATDDSHSFGNWNAPPPNDPLHYGMAIYTVNESDKAQIAEFSDDYSEPVIISMTKVGNSEFLQKGFTLKKETDLHILALGEYGYDDAFADYGWIENVLDAGIVWEMTEDNTEHAGGAKKNRKFDGVITLPAGDYMVYYATDDSHSYRRWNSSAPIERDMWGISIYGMGKDFDAKSVQTYDDFPEGGSMLVNLTGIGDNESVQQSFELKQEQKVKIVALGEGSDGEMYDYGWIEDAKTGETIWEMTYRKTHHAGGAQKNRRAEARIALEAGEYEVFYETDGSHSFPDFNASRPTNPQKWGIMIFKE